ncbi:unnamed protein product [Prunus armeniaca]
MDIGASHNFMSMQESKRLGCRVSKEAGSMKTVNSTAKPIDGVACGVELHIAAWKGVADFFVIPMDDYDVVLGMEFMDKGGAMPCMVIVVRQQGKSKVLSAMQLSKSWKKGEPTFLATMKMDTVEKEVKPVPKAMKVDHTIEEEPVLRLPDLSKPLEVHTDASDFAIGGVLMQDGHLFVFESQKLNVTKRRYIIQEKEMTAVVHCLGTWRHCLLGSQFVVKTDNVVTSYFQSQQKLSPKQARWQDFLAEFDYKLEYKEEDLCSKVGQSEALCECQPMRLGKVVGWCSVLVQLAAVGVDMLNPSQHKSTRKLHKALLRRYEGPFPIIRTVGRVAYHVELPPRLKIHPVFHMSNLKPYHANPEEPSRGESQRAPPLMVTSFDREVECIMAKRKVRRKGVLRYFEYFVKWKGLPESEGNWEKKESL